MTQEESMATRLAEIIEYKTGGNKAEFARLMGWSKQYLHNMFKGTSPIGLSPLQTIITKIPELNARWFLTGEGNMIDTASHVIRTWFALEEFIPVMTTDERNSIENGGGYSMSDIERWKNLIIERKNAINARFAASYAKQGK